MASQPRWSPAMGRGPSVAHRTDRGSLARKASSSRMCAASRIGPLPGNARPENSRSCATAAMDTPGTSPRSIRLIDAADRPTAEPTSTMDSPRSTRASWIARPSSMLIVRARGSPRSSGFSWEAMAGSWPRPLARGLSAGAGSPRSQVAPDDNTEPRRRGVRGTLGDDAEPCALEHRERAGEGGFGMEPLAGIDDDRIGLEGLRALLPRERDRPIEQRPGQATTTSRCGHREAGDRPDWTIVDRWDHLRADDALEIDARANADPADRSRTRAFALQCDETRRMITLGLSAEPVPPLGHPRRAEVLRAPSPVLAPAPTPVAALAEERLEGGPGLVRERGGPP